jgi:hypothetical protein
MSETSFGSCIDLSIISVSVCSTTLKYSKLEKYGDHKAAHRLSRATNRFSKPALALYGRDRLS